MSYEIELNELLWTKIKNIKDENVKNALIGLLKYELSIRNLPTQRFTEKYREIIDRYTGVKE